MGLASALNTALTGLSASETTINVVGNNIANSTTVGFKQSGVDFATQFAQTLSLGSGPSSTSGGTNPTQIGLGVQVAQITPDFTQGTIQTTSTASDLAIQGQGFFIVEGAGGQQQYTRDGSFKLNSENQLVSTSGQRVLGQGVDSNFNIQSTTLQPMTIPLGSSAVAQATQNVFLQGDLSPSGTIATTPAIIESKVLSDGSVEVPPNLAATDISAIAPASTSGTTVVANTGAGNIAAGTYSYEVTFVNAAGQEGPPAKITTPITTTGTAGVDQAIDLNNLPALPSGFSSMNVYRADAASGGTYKLAGSTSGTSFTDTKADASLGANAPGTLAQGNYSYYVTYYNSVTGLESRPTAVIGPQSVAVDGRDIELKNLPSPASTNFNQLRVYRNLSTDSNSFYLVSTLAKGTSTYIDNASDASISTGASAKKINLDGPSISPGTLLSDVVSRDGASYTNPFANATSLSFTGNKGGATLDTKTFNVSPTTTVQDFINFIDQATGIQPTSADGKNPLTGNPGGSVDLTNSTLAFQSNEGTANAVSIGISAITVNTASGTQTVNLNFNSTQAANGSGASTDLVVYDSLGIPINVKLTTVLESSNSLGTVYRWFADSGNNAPVSGVGIAVGTGQITFDGQGNVSNVTNSTVSVARSNVASQPLQFKLDFSQVSGLSAATNTLSASRQDGSAAGTLSSYNIGSNGLISGVFSNGVTRSLGQVRLANFSNDAGLEQAGNNLFSAGVNSGLPVVGNPGQQGIGTIISGATEQSNTDIGKNLIRLITASTEYQGGARVITTVQQLFNDLFNLGR